MGSALSSSSSNAQPCTHQQSCTPACSGMAALGGTAPQRRAEGGTLCHAMWAPVLGFLGTGEQLGGGAGGTARLLPRLVKGLAAIPQLGAAPKAQPLKAWHKAHLIFLSPVSVLFEAVHLLLRFFFFPQPSPVPPWLRGDSNNNTPSAAMTRAQKALAALRWPWARHPSSSDTAWGKVQPPEDVWQHRGARPRSPDPLFWEELYWPSLPPSQACCPSRNV